MWGGGGGGGDFVFKLSTFLRASFGSPSIGKKIN